MVLAALSSLYRFYIDNNSLSSVYLVTMQQSRHNLLVFRWLLAVWLAIACPVSPAAAADVINIRLGVHPDHTRVVLDLSGPAGYRIEPQNDPHRVVIALEGAGLRLAGDVPAGRGLVQIIRIEQETGGGGRIILDLAEPARVRQSQALQASASAPARIFIDLQSGGADEIAAAINEHPVAPTVGPKPDRAPEITVPVVVADDVKAARMAAAPVQVA